MVFFADYWLCFSCFAGLFMAQYTRLSSTKMKPMMKSRTMWFSFLLVIFGSLFENFSYLQSSIDPRYYGVSVVVIGLICAVLRFITTEPVK